MQERNDHKILKNNWKLISNKYLLQTILWILLTISLLIFISLFQIYKSEVLNLLKWDFFNNKLDFVNYQMQNEDIILFEIYLFISLISSSIASITLIIIQGKIITKKYIQVKYQILFNINNNYFIFKNLLIANIAQNVNFIFCVTNAFTFLFVLTYFLIYFIIDTILDKNFKLKKNQIKTKWWNSNQRNSKFTILFIEITYFLLKNIFDGILHNVQEVNFEKILKYFVPASSLALIIAIFFQNLVKNNVKKILKNMKNATVKASDFKIFYKLEAENVLQNYQFIKDLPIIIKNKINKRNISRKKILKLIHEIYQLIDKLECCKKNNNIKENEINYLIYHIFYETKSEVELKQIAKIIQNKLKNEELRASKKPKSNITNLKDIICEQLPTNLEDKIITEEKQPIKITNDNQTNEVI